jgi:3-hydroxyacyl-CoA dehydrogenase/enoyl-CoA hydratase/3-hydroxybutyryl-CoA epimerase
VHTVKSKRLPESAVYVLEKMAHGYRRMGRAGGAGFYDYGSEPPQLWSGLKTFERGSRKIPPDDVRDRLVYAATVRALAHDAAEEPLFWKVFGPGVPGDAASALGSAAVADRARFLERSRELAGRYGSRFEPSQAVLDRLASGAR